MRQNLFKSLLIILLLTGACVKKPKIIRISNYLTRSLHDTLFYHINPPSLNLILKMRIQKNFEKLRNIHWIDSFYKARNFELYLVPQFLEGHSIDSLTKFLRMAKDHGLDPKYYGESRIHEALNLLHLHRYKSLVPAYIALIDLEINSLNALLSYSKDLEYGRLNPKLLYPNQFNIKFKQADSSFDARMGKIHNLIYYLDSIQPRSSTYRILKNTLHRLIAKNPENWEGLNPYNDSIAKIRVNLERLRWQSLDTSSRLLLVNIPRFKLYAIDSGKIIWSMKVCVGGPKKKNYDSAMSVYHITHDIDDRPENHQTPVLYSLIQSIEANPKWSVPKSILQNEIFYKILKNPLYLQENKMKIYKGNTLIRRPDTIHWEKISRGKINYTLKQDAGDYNSLGKLKFNFQNPYSVYLHDTPEKKAFNLKARDISHGCVRVVDPLKLAAFLLSGNEKNSMDLLRIKIGLKPGDDSTIHLQKLYKKEQEALLKNDHSFEPSSIPLKVKTSIFLQYFTAWSDEENPVYLCNDIYRMDKIVLDNLH